MVVHGAKRFASEVLSSVKGLYWDMGLRSSFEIPVRKGMRFRFARYGDVARMLYMQSHLVRFGKSFETGMLDLFCSRLSPGATVIDVGANVGMYSMAASRLVGPQGRVLAMSPTPSPSLCCVATWRRTAVRMSGPSRWRSRTVQDG